MYLGGLAWNNHDALGIRGGILPSKLHESNGCCAKIRVGVVKWDFESGTSEIVEAWCPDKLSRRLDLSDL
ncbi:unnamed protein product [Fusarium graminearum]|nr:unnamed protein product [Fusarium graminearum]